MILLAKREEDGHEVTAYVAVPAPRFPGQAPAFAPHGVRAPPECIETGRIGDDMAALTERIAERVRSEWLQRARELLRIRFDTVGRSLAR